LLAAAPSPFLCLTALKNPPCVNYSPSASCDFSTYSVIVLPFL
jgi:hypothetical protein